MFLKPKWFACWLLIAGTQAFTTTSTSPSLHPTTTTSTTSLLQSSTSSQTDLGIAKVDMNKYNLPLEEIADEWSANVVAESTLREAGVYLGAKNDKSIMVDTVQVKIPRRVGEGMGILLLEIAGGREDGLGITVIDGVVEGGCADGCDVMDGDSIAAVSVRKVQRQDGKEGLADMEVVDSIELECFGYDKTVEALSSLPPAESDDEILVLTLKRLRRKPKVIVKLQYPPQQEEPDITIELFAGENLRRAMLTRGVKLNDPLSQRFDNGGTGNCGADGTCATCVVGVLQGDGLLSPKGQQETQILKKNPRWRMACKTIVGFGQQEGEMTIRVNPRQWNN
jgi:ferredoxin